MRPHHSLIQYESIVRDMGAQFAHVIAYEKFLTSKG